MRKLIGLVLATAALAGAGVALAGQGATDSKGRFIDINVAVTPPVAGTKKTPQGVGVSFDSFTGNRINGDTPDNSKSISVRFNKGFTYNGLLFPACKINPTSTSKCSKATEIGTGTGEGSLPGANGAAPTFVPASVVVYNGKPFGGVKAPTVIFVASLGGKPALELDFTAKPEQSGPYGLAFNSIQFSGAPTSALSITKFSFKIPDRTVTTRVHGKSVKVHLVDAPTTCSGSWQFAQTNTFTDGPPITATDSQPCTKS